MGKLRARSGQSLIELLIAVALAVVVIISAMQLMQFLGSLGSYDPVAQTGVFLATDLMNSVVATAHGAWGPFAAGTPGTHYYLVANAGGFGVAVGDEPPQTVNGVQYARYFTIDFVARDANDMIIPSSGAQDTNNDPSTKKIAVMVSWNYQGKPYSHSIEGYVARTRNETVLQTDWVGGPACATDDPVIGAGSTNNRFCTTQSGAVDYATSPGSIKIQGF